jgi:hypothetical protein
VCGWYISVFQIDENRFKCRAIKHPKENFEYGPTFERAIANTVKMIGLSTYDTLKEFGL